MANAHVLPLSTVQDQSVAGEGRERPADRRPVETVAAIVGDDGAAGCVVEWVPAGVLPMDSLIMPFGMESIKVSIKTRQALDGYAYLP